MSTVTPGTTVEVLQYLHSKLDTHFQLLFDRRSALEPVSPVFALEHDLSDPEIELLKEAVRSGIRQSYLTHFGSAWLPFVVYAAEMGYGYEGDEYWTTFSSETPHWTYQERDTIRTWFIRFANQYGGARPTGAWAAHRTIISWPITHAVLPVYLQRQLAQLLFEFRTGLTSPLLRDPDELGIRLAARAGQYSDRFRIFCQNTQLLGQVAAALLSGEDEDSPYLVKSTLGRLLEGLSYERQARHWLTSARQAASRVRATGFARTLPGGNRTHSGVERLPRATDPRFFLRRLDGAWHAYAELHDMTPLSERLPQVYDELRTLRGRVNGGHRLVARGGLVRDRQEIRFESWPNPSKPFVQLENGSDAANAILADQAVMTSGPWWVYSRQGSGTAIEVKGGFLRPGHHYILVGTQGLEPPAVPWCMPTSLAVTGANAWSLDVPDPLSDADAALLIARGMSTLSTVTVRPVGIVASAWDGEGAVEWLAGEPAMLGIRAEVAPARSLITVDGDPHFVTWPAEQRELILSIDGLDVGSHVVTATLIGADDQELANGALAITIRDPQVRPEGATVGEGIRLLASPARPTLAELWDQRATVTVDGPPEANADLVVSLRGEDARELGVIRRNVTLPIGQEDWAAHARDIRTERVFEDYYDEAEWCLITVYRDGVGLASLTCERGFQPLRWRFRKEHDGSFMATLHDRTDGGNTKVEFYGVERPLAGVEYGPSAPIPLQARGGLLRATAGDVEKVVLAPTQPNKVMDLGRASPHVPYGDASNAEVMRLANAHWLWTSADLPADPIAVWQQQIALEAINRATVMMLCGSRWSQIERKLATADADEVLDHLDDMKAAIGISPAHKAVAQEVSLSLFDWSAREKLLTGFASVIAATLRESGIENKLSAPRFLLTMAGCLGYITQQWSGRDRNYLLDRIKVSPVLLRAARYAVLGSRALNEQAEVQRGI